MAGKSKAHPGFGGAEKQIAAKSHVSEAAAGRILGAAQKKYTPKTVAANPRLKNIPAVAKRMRGKG